MVNLNLFTVNFLFILCSCIFSLKAQVHQSVIKFKETDFYTFFNFKLDKQNGNLEVYKPGAFQEFLELQVSQNQGKIEKMLLTIDQEFIKKQKLLAADIFKSFILLHVGEDNKDYKNMMEILYKGDPQKQYGYYLDQILRVFESYDNFFVIPLKEQNYTLVIQIKNFKLITTAIKNVNPQPIGNSNYQFFDDKIIQDLNYKWESQLKSLKTQSNNERNWVSENGGLRQLKQVQWHFDSPQSAVQYFLENFEYFTEKGEVLDIFNSKEIKFFGEYAIAVEVSNSNPEKSVIIAFVRNKVCHKLVIKGKEDLNFIDALDLAKKINP